MPTTTSPDLLDTAALRAQEFPAAAEAVYLNAASVAPVPERARRAVEAYNQRRARVHTLRGEDFVEPLTRCRAAAAELVGADAGEIALGGNTSFGINLAALGLPLPRGSAIVASDREFPANVYPWMRCAERGVHLDLVPTDALGRPDEDRILERLGRGDVSLFALSAVQFATGYRADLERFGRVCREHGIWFVVDGIQAAGQLPIDVRAMHIDVLATGGHKWLCGPFGSGFAYIRRELHDVLNPAAIGWSSMPACENLDSVLNYHFEPYPDARRYEVATPAFQNFLGLADSVRLLLDTGVERIQRHLLALLDPLVGWLRDAPGMEIVSDLAPERRSGILCFRTRDTEATFRALTDAGVLCSFREGVIRLAPHLYNDTNDLDRVMNVLQRMQR